MGAVVPRQREPRDVVRITICIRRPDRMREFHNSLRYFGDCVGHVLMEAAAVVRTVEDGGIIIDVEDVNNDTDVA